MERPDGQSRIVGEQTLAELDALAALLDEAPNSPGRWEKRRAINEAANGDPDTHDFFAAALYSREALTSRANIEHLTYQVRLLVAIAEQAGEQPIPVLSLGSQPYLMRLAHPKTMPDQFGANRGIQTDLAFVGERIVIIYPVTSRDEIYYEKKLTIKERIAEPSKPIRISLAPATDYYAYDPAEAHPNNFTGEHNYLVGPEAIAAYANTLCQYELYHLKRLESESSHRPHLPLSQADLYNSIVLSDAFQIWALLNKGLMSHEVSSGEYVAEVTMLWRDSVADQITQHFKALYREIRERYGVTNYGTHPYPATDGVTLAWLAKLFNCSTDATVSILQQEWEKYSDRGLHRTKAADLALEAELEAFKKMADIEWER